jgi:hypothetical protein
MIDLLAEIRAVTESDARFVYVDEGFLPDHDVEPWDGLPALARGWVESRPRWHDGRGRLARGTSRASTSSPC